MSHQAWTCDERMALIAERDAAIARAETAEGRVAAAGRIMVLIRATAATAAKANGSSLWTVVSEPRLADLECALTPPSPSKGAK